MKFQFAYTRLLVKDYYACYSFYHDILGLETTFISEIDTYAELTNGNVKLTLLNRNKLDEYLGTKTSFFFGQKSDGIALSFKVKNIEKTCQYLKEKGIELISPPWNFPDWGTKLVLIRDPEGNLLELSQAGSLIGAE